MRTGDQGKLSFKTDRTGGWARAWMRLKQFPAAIFRLGRRGWTRFMVRQRFLVGVFAFLVLAAAGWGIGRRLRPSAGPTPLVVEEKPAVVTETVTTDYETLLREIQTELAALQARLMVADPAQTAQDQTGQTGKTAQSAQTAQTAAETDPGPAFTPLKLVPPVAGKVTKRSGWEKKAGEWRYHSGVDLAVPPGTPVVAAAAGMVAEIKTDAALGTVVLLDHGHGWQSLYGQLTGVQVATGQQVAQGALLGYSARTSCGPAPGIHFNLYCREDPVDPLTMLDLALE
ncbi:MAG: peptidoglycan DD-metalloendopeptidase family protein [Firmicutes bacterium]|nr:peptidoglycan DD-metalloendopeptidase family protein [Bacillota bacterium]